MVVLLMSLSLLTMSNGQDDLRSLLSHANTIQQKGDFLFAARLFKMVASKATDSTLISEALYGFVTCGDRAANAFTSRQFTLETFYRIKAESTWNDVFKPILERDIAEFTKIGIPLKIISYFETYCVNADTSTRQLLSNRFGDTPFGERAAFDLITGELDSRGYPLFNHPDPVIKRANSFLERFPNSIYAYDVAHILGLAFQDLWNFSQRHPDMLTKSELKSPQELRQRAIYHLSYARDNQAKLRKVKWDSSSKEVLDDLKSGRETSYYFFFSD